MELFMENSRFGMLVVVERVKKETKNRSKYWLCKCDCGNERTVCTNMLTSGNAKSCGCHDWNGKSLCNEENYYELLREKINKSVQIDGNSCWIWIRSKHKQGYGNLNFKHKPNLAHRVCWEIYKGEIPEGLNVCHLCDVPSCCNPEHLFLGTQKDNMKDCLIKGRLGNRKLPPRRNKLNYEQVQE